MNSKYRVYFLATVGTLALAACGGNSSKNVDGVTNVTDRSEAKDVPAKEPL